MLTGVARGVGDMGEGGQGPEGKGQASKCERGRVDKETRARAWMDMVEDNDKKLLKS